MSNYSSKHPVRSSPLLVPIGLIVAYLASQTVAWNWPAASSYFRFQAFVGCTSLAALLIAVWCLFNRSLSTVTKYSGVGICCLAMLFAMKATRVDGYLGDATPNVTWSWLASRTASVLTESQPNDVAATHRIDTSISESDSPGFLGVKRDGTIHGQKLSTDWAHHPPKQLWRRSVGAAWSSFAVAGNVAITQEQRADSEATVCYDLNTGEERWAHLEPGIKFSEAYGGEGPRATPTIHDGFVYSLGATGVLNCLHGTTGERVWTTNILEDADADNLGWGMSGSPLVCNGCVVVNPGGKQNRSVIAYNAFDGEIRWQAGNGQASYSSPMQTTIAGVQQIILLNGPALESYEPSTGELLWSYPWIVNDAVMTSIAQPVVVGHDRVFISSGYGKGCALIELTTTGQHLATREVWSPNRTLKSKLSNVVVRDGFAYGLDEQVLVCLDLATGQRQWKAGRYGYGQILRIDDTLLIQTESGDVVLVRATPTEHREITRFSPLSTKTWTVPVVAKNKLLVRNDREAACYELSLEE